MTLFLSTCFFSEKKDNKYGYSLMDMRLVNTAQTIGWSKHLQTISYLYCGVGMTPTISFNQARRVMKEMFNAFDTFPLSPVEFYEEMFKMRKLLDLKQPEYNAETWQSLIKETVTGYIKIQAAYARLYEVMEHPDLARQEFPPVPGWADNAVYDDLPLHLSENRFLTLFIK